MEVVGGSAYHRDTGIERLFRDIQAARFHRPQVRTQRDFSGSLALRGDLDS